MGKKSHDGCIPPAVSAQNLRPTDTQAASRGQAGIAIPQHCSQSPEVQHTLNEMHERMSSKDSSHHGCSLTSTQVMSKKRVSCMVSGPEGHTQTAGGVKRARCTPISVPGTKAAFVVPPQHVAPRPSGGVESAAKNSPTFWGEVYLTAALPLAQSSPDTLHFRYTRESMHLNENGNACIWQLEDISYIILYFVSTVSSSICSFYL